MATNYWIGKAPAVKQITGVVPATIEVGDIFRVTIGGQVIQFTATGTTVANVVAGLLAAWNASTHPYVTAVVATNGTTQLTLTANVAGVPFTVTTSTVDGGGANTQTLVATTTTASSGPNDWSTAANWSLAAVPVNADDVYIENSASSILWGLAQSAVTLASLNIGQSFTGAIGLATDNFVAVSSTPEYRATYLQVGATAWAIGYKSGDGQPTGSGRIKIDFGSVQFTGNISGSAATPLEPSLKPIRILGSHASNVLNITKGSVGIAADRPGETATVLTLNQGFQGAQTSDSDVRLGSGVTLTTLNISGGTCSLNSAATTLNVSGGTLTTSGTGAVTTINVLGGTLTHYATGAVTTLNVERGVVHYNGTGTITTANVAGGQLDLSRDPRAKTLTNANLFAGASLNSDNGNPFSITYSNGINLQRCGEEDVTIRLGRHCKLTVAAL